MERWRPETNTFHMYHGEVSITLQDVAHLTGLSVSGEALYVEYENSMNWAALVEEVLGRSPVGHMKDGGRVMMRWLYDNFYSCADVEDGPELRQYACAYMLSSIGAFLMPDRSSAYVHCQYLLIEGGPTSTSAGDIGGWMVLLQAWCLERFPSIARRMHERGLTVTPVSNNLITSLLEVRGQPITGMETAFGYIFHSKNTLTLPKL
ncbi:Serine/threonine-protein phosphatase 7 long form homolog [Linum grandiflorum]